MNRITGKCNNPILKGEIKATIYRATTEGGEIKDECNGCCAVEYLQRYITKDFVADKAY